VPANKQILSRVALQVRLGYPYPASSLFGSHDHRNRAFTSQGGKSGSNQRIGAKQYDDTKRSNELESPAETQGATRNDCHVHTCTRGIGDHVLGCCDIGRLIVAFFVGKISASSAFAKSVDEQPDGAAAASNVTQQNDCKPKANDAAKHRVAGKLILTVIRSFFT
jgi:hypothetical protein